MKRLLTLSTLCGAIAALHPSMILAQETDPGEGGEFIESSSTMVIEADGDGINPPAIQVFSSSDGGTNMGMFVATPAMSPMGDAFTLANNEDIQKELELLDDQVEQLNAINKEFSEQISEELKGLREGNMNLENPRRLADLIQELEKKKRARMQEILLPHQFDRLQQISLQQQMKHRGEAATLMSDQIAEQLGITDEQKERMKERSEEIKKDLAEKIEQLKLEARDELLQELTREQRKKLEELTGPAYEIKPVDMSERIRKARERRSQSQQKQDQ